jgi:hypothetical protein
MSWSIFHEGGGPGAALTWADDLLTSIGAPKTPGNEQFVYDWETSEGGGGAFNPLNQGPVPGQPQLTTTGSQFGGGAADYASWDAGLRGAADYLNMTAFAPIRQDLIAGQPEAARAALIASPWAASHYNGGAAFSSAPVPGQPGALAGQGGPGGLGWNPLNWPGEIASGATSSILSGLIAPLENAAITIPIVLAGAAVGVAGLIMATRGPRQRIEQRTAERGTQAAELAAVAA